eukprot:m51a1_g10833 hypothetical protein (902) ;mRNA; r:37751-42519
MAEDGAASGVSVTIRDCAFARKSNYFVALVLEAASSPDRGRTARTEVQRNTRSPKFATNTFLFHLPLDMPSPAPDLIEQSHPKLFITANEVNRRKGQPVVETFGHYVLALDPAIAHIRAAAGSPLPARRWSQTIELQRKHKDSPDLKEAPGKLVVDVYTPVDQRTWFTVHVHAAINLPLVAGNVPSPFALAKTASEQRAKKQARATTLIAKTMRNAVWQEPMRIDVPQNGIEEEGLFLALIDYSTKKYLAKCAVPLSELQPACQYHLGLVLNEEGAYMLVSMNREPSISDERAQFSAARDLLRLEVELHGFLEDLPRIQSLLAVLQPFDDVEEYMSLAEKAMTDPTAKPITFISLPSIRPSWDTSVPLTVSKSMLANPRAAVVVEFFRCDVLGSGDDRREGKRFFYYGYAVLQFTTIADHLQFGETREYSLAVTSSDKSKVSISLEMTVWDSANYLASLETRGMRAPIDAPAPQADMSPGATSFDMCSAFPLNASVSESSNGVSVFLPPSPGLFSQPQTPTLMQDRPTSSSKLADRRPLGLSVQIPSGSNQNRERPRSREQASSSCSPRMPATPPPPLMINVGPGYESSDEYESGEGTPGGPKAPVLSDGSAGSRSPDLDKIVRDRQKLLCRIKALETDLGSMKTMNVQLMEENRHLTSLLSQREESSVSLDDLKGATIDEVNRKFASLAHNLQSEISLRKATQVKYQEAQHKLSKKAALKKEFQELQQSYKQQCIFTETLKDENAKIPSLEEKTRKQDKVIGRLATMLKAAMKALHARDVAPSSASSEDPARTPILDDDKVQATLDEIMITTRMPTLSPQLAPSTASPVHQAAQQSAGAPPSPMSLARQSSSDMLRSRPQTNNGESRHPLPVRHPSGVYRKPPQNLAPLEQRDRDKAQQQ